MFQVHIMLFLYKISMHNYHKHAHIDHLATGFHCAILLSHQYALIFLSQPITGPIGALSLPFAYSNFSWLEIFLLFTSSMHFVPKFYLSKPTNTWDSGQFILFNGVSFFKAFSFSCSSLLWLLLIYICICFFIFQPGLIPGCELQFIFSSIYYLVSNSI